ncbi:uracil-DNA glycosylase [Psychrobacillus sp. FSL K6-2684]|uniref:uracil-DNA glycosylase n=1 Tax=unclassified Psychrobacillus TaxID=2636677 RepID=UPI0030F93526
MISIDYFTRLKEIANNVKPYEINMVTHIEGWEDSIDMRGKNLLISVTEENIPPNKQIIISDEKGLSVTILFDWIDTINEYRNTDHTIFEVYLFVNEGIARITIRGKMVIINKPDKKIEYNKIIKQAKSCTKCEAMQEIEAVIGYQNGNLNADIMFIAEAPGPRGADVTGIPLHGDATGKNFEKLLASTRWTRSEVFITNAVLCCPTSENGTVRSPIRQEVKNCRSYLSSMIDLVNPKVIVTLGKKALEAIKEIENHQLVLNHDVATFTKWNNRWVYPLYHPSPQVINTGVRTSTQQTTDFKQLDYNYKYIIEKDTVPKGYRNE